MPDERQTSSARPPGPSSARLPGTVAIGVAVAVVTYFCIYAFVPSARFRLSKEDGLIEVTTAFVFLAAFAVGTIGMVRTRPPRSNWLIPLLGLLGFLDEMKLGATLLPFSSPVIDRIEVDSFHDVLIVADRFLADLGVTRLHVVLLLGVVALATLTLVLRKGHLRGFPTWLATHRPLAIAAGAVVLILLGIALDQLSDRPAVRFLEETAEFAASGLVLVAATAIHTEHAVTPAPIRSI